MAKKASQTCLICGESKAGHSFIKHRNELLVDNVGFCKDCVKDNIDLSEQETLIDMLRLLNIPFVSDIWESAAEKEPDSTFGKYLQLIATNRKYKTFSDSSNPSVGTPDDDFEITKDTIARWGAGKTKDEYYVMEAKYDSLCGIKEPITPLEKQLYIQNVKLSQTLDDALESGDSKTIPNLKKAYKDDLKNLGLDVSSVSSDDVGTLGTRIHDWENSKPVPSLSKEFEDVDGINNYVTRFFSNTMKRVFGLATEEEVNSIYD